MQIEGICWKTTNLPGAVETSDGERCLCLAKLLTVEAHKLYIDFLDY